MVKTGSLTTRLFMNAAMVFFAKAAKDDVDNSLRVCNYEEDLQVEFSECDTYGTTRNGKFEIDDNAADLILTLYLYYSLLLLCQCNANE